MVASGLRSRHVQFLLKGINHRLRRPQPLCLPQTGSYLDVSSRAKCYSTAAFFLGEKYGLVRAFEAQTIRRATSRQKGNKGETSERKHPIRRNYEHTDNIRIHVVVPRH